MHDIMSLCIGIVFPYLHYVFESCFSNLSRPLWPSLSVFFFLSTYTECYQPLCLRFSRYVVHVGRTSHADVCTQYIHVKTQAMQKDAVS